MRLSLLARVVALLAGSAAVTLACAAESGIRILLITPPSFARSPAASSR